MRRISCPDLPDEASKFPQILQGICLETSLLKPAVMPKGSPATHTLPYSERLTFVAISDTLCWSWSGSAPSSGTKTVLVNWQCRKGNTMMIKTAYFLVKTIVKLKDNREAFFPFHTHLFPLPIKVILTDFIGVRVQENLNGWFKRSICCVLALQNKSHGWRFQKGDSPVGDSLTDQGSRGKRR